MNGPQHLARALDLAHDARTADSNDEDIDRVVAIYLEGIIEMLAALTLATVHPHLSRGNGGDWNEVAK